MAYSQGHPLMMIVEQGVRSEGLLERGHDWYVQTMKADPVALTTVEFNSVLASWKLKLNQHPAKIISPMSPTELTVGELVGSMKQSQLWSLLVVVTVLIVGSFTLSGKLLGS